MREDTLIKQYLDEFNSIIMDMNDIDIKIDNKDRDLIVLCLLPAFYPLVILSYRKIFH